LHVVGLVNADGAERARFDYDSWGNLLVADGTATDEAFRYRSGFRDRATGLYQFGARWYDPQVGRWLTQDPLLQSLILARSDLLPRWAELSNLYAYASNNPGLQFDPTGMGPSLPKGWPQPPGWKGGFKWKWVNNQPGGELVDPDGGRWHWHPEDADHNEHWDYRDKRDKWRLDKDGKDLGDDAFKPQEDEDTVCEPGEEGGGSGAPLSGGGSASEDDSGITKRILQGGGVVAAGYGLWTVGKWTAALLAAPETEGGSLVLAGLTP